MSYVLLAFHSLTYLPHNHVDYFTLVIDLSEMLWSSSAKSPIGLLHVIHRLRGPVVQPVEQQLESCVRLCSKGHLRSQ